MSKPDYLDQLIDLASATAGSDAKLAEELGVSRGNVTDWRKGRRPCPAGDQALMAGIAGLDAGAWAQRAVVAQYEGTEKGRKLAAKLGKALLVTGAVIGSSGAIAATSVIAAGNNALHWIAGVLYTMYRPVKLNTATAS